MENNIFEIMAETLSKTPDAGGFDVIRLMVAPVLSLVTAIMAITVFSASYFIVFRIKKYLKRHKNYLNFTNKLLATITGKKVSVLRPYETTMWGPKLEQNKALVGDILTQYKNADLKDLILGTYNDDLNSIKAIINSDNKLIKNNEKFVKFQRLFHVYTKDGMIIEYLNKDYVSFYRVKKSGVTIGVLKKDELESRGIKITYDVDYADIFEKNDLHKLTTVYQIYFIKNNFIYKNISNPIVEMELELSKMRKTYSRIFKKKYKHYNVYIKDKLKGFPKLNVLLTKDIYSIHDNLLLELIVQKPVISNPISASIKKRKEIKEVINYRNNPNNKEIPKNKIDDDDDFKQ